MDKVEYLPGEHGVITAIFKTKGRYGHNSKPIRITTDSKLTPKVTITLKVNVVAEIRPFETNIHFNKIMDNKEYIKKVLIENNMNVPVEIKNIKFDKINKNEDDFEINIKTEKSDDMKEYFVFSIKQIKKLNSFNTVSIPVTISTNSSKIPELRFYLLVHLAKPIEIEPSSLYIYRAEIGNDQIKRISIESNLNSPLEIKKIYSEKYPLTFNVVSESDSIKHIWVGISDKGTPGNFNDLIRIEIKSGDFEKNYTIPVRGNAKLK